MQDGASGETGRLDLLLDIVREQGEQRKGIKVLEGSVKQATVAVQEATKEMQFATSGAGTPGDCDAKHEAVAKRIVTELTPIIAANGNGTTSIKRSFLPKNFLEWCAALAIVGSGVWGLVQVGGWLAGRDMMPGQPAHAAEGIEIIAQPEDPLLLEIRRLNEYLSGRRGAATITPGEPTWGMVGSDTPDPSGTAARVGYP